jgi:2-(3-amino-3-carboxypropyl)histidine synthase
MGGICMKGFDFEEERIKREITKLGSKTVLLQFPEGLKPEGPRIAKIVEEAGALPIISADPCYGACDIAVNEAEGLGVDLIVHFGHAKLMISKIPTIYVEARSTVAVKEAVEKALPLLSNYSKIGLATTVQHLDTLKQTRTILLKAGKTVIIGTCEQMSYPGQVTGCNYGNVKSIADQVDVFLFIGGGMFHALGIALSTSKPTFIADPYDNRAFSINDETQKIIKQRWACVQEALNAKTFGVLVGSKPGQKHLDEALVIKEIAKQHGKTAYLLTIKEIIPETLLEFPSIDAYVNTACPRISLEASQKFSKPVLTINEFMVAIGEYSWENMLKKGLFEN